MLGRLSQWVPTTHTHTHTPNAVWTLVQILRQIWAAAAEAEADSGDLILQSHRSWGPVTDVRVSLLNPNREVMEMEGVQARDHMISPQSGWEESKQRSRPVGPVQPLLADLVRNLWFAQWEWIFFFSWRVVFMAAWPDRLIVSPGDGRAQSVPAEPRRRGAGAGVWWRCSRRQRHPALSEEGNRSDCGGMNAESWKGMLFFFPFCHRIVNLFSRWDLSQQCGLSHEAQTVLTPKNTNHVCMIRMFKWGIFTHTVIYG